MFADVCGCLFLQTSAGILFFRGDDCCCAPMDTGAQTTIISATSRNGDHAGAFFVLVGVDAGCLHSAVIRGGSGPDVASCLVAVLRHPASCWGRYDGSIADGI